MAKIFQSETYHRGHIQAEALQTTHKPHQEREREKERGHVLQSASCVPNGPDPTEQNSQRLWIERSKNSLVTRDYQNRPESKAVSFSSDSQENPETVCRLADDRCADPTRKSAG